MNGLGVRNTFVTHTHQNGFEGMELIWTGFEPGRKWLKKIVEPLGEGGTQQLDFLIIPDDDTIHN